MIGKQVQHITEVNPQVSSFSPRCLPQFPLFLTPIAAPTYCPCSLTSCKPFADNRIPVDKASPFTFVCMSAMYSRLLSQLAKPSSMGQDYLGTASTETQVCKRRTVLQHMYRYVCSLLEL